MKSKRTMSLVSTCRGRQGGGACVLECGAASVLALRVMPRIKAERTMSAVSTWGRERCGACGVLHVY